MRTSFNKFSPTAARGNRGFTLVEIAIVLLIFAVIIGGVFMMVGGAMKSQKTNRVSQQVISILQNVRNYTSHIDNSSVSLAMSDFDCLGLLPKDIGTSGCSGNSGSGTSSNGGGGSSQDSQAVNIGQSHAASLAAQSSTYNHALGQQIDGCAAGGANTLSCSTTGATTGIAIVLYNMDSDSCVNTIAKLSSSATDLGLVQYGVNGTASTNYSMGTLGTTCGTAPPNNVEFDFSF